MPTEPLILSTWSFARRGNDAAWPALAEGGSSLDAVERVCCVTELDPDVDSVGLGGLPDRSGRVTLDGSIMLSPRECGSVCAVSRHLHVVSIARLVMEKTPHVMLAGDGADDLADAHGLPPAELLSDGARARWLEWRRNPHTVDQSRDAGSPPRRPFDTGEGGRLFAPRGDEGARGGHDTVCALAIDRRGTLAGACSTSGSPFKLPGRVGDSPIIGHALYVDPGAGAATATGTGELVMGLCSSYHVVEEMRRGRSPIEAVRDALDRVRTTYELRDEHQVAMLALRADGSWSAGAVRSGYKTVVTDAGGTRVVDAE